LGAPARIDPAPSAPRGVEEVRCGAARELALGLGEGDREPGLGAHVVQELDEDARRILARSGRA
jgi:hypothetical protein